MDREQMQGQGTELVMKNQISRKGLEQNLVIYYNASSFTSHLHLLPATLSPLSNGPHQSIQDLLQFV